MKNTAIDSPEQRSETHSTIEQNSENTLLASRPSPSSGHSPLRHVSNGDENSGHTSCHTSWRKISPGRIRAKSITESYQALPSEIPHPNEILKIFATAGDCLPFPPAALRTLNALFTFARSTAWDQDYGPFVWPTNETLSLNTGLALRTIKTHLSLLEEAGALFVKLGPGGRRRPLDTHNAQRATNLTHDTNYGIYLAPLADMAVQVHQETRKMCAAARHAAAMRGRITECCQEISACIDALLDVQNLPDDPNLPDTMMSKPDTVPALLRQLRVLEQDVMEIAANTARSRNPEDLKPSLDYALRCRADAYGLAAQIMDWTEGDWTEEGTNAPEPHEASNTSSSPSFFVSDSHESPEGAEDDTQNTTTQPTKNSKRYKESVGHIHNNPNSKKTAGPTDKMALEKSVVKPSPENPAPSPSWLHDDTNKREALFTPGLALFLYPALSDIAQTYLGIPPASADQMNDAQFQATIDILRGKIGLSDSAYHQALLVHGFNRVSALVIIAAIKPSSELRVDRKAFLAGTLRRPVDQVHIWPTLHKLRKLRKNGSLPMHRAPSPASSSPSSQEDNQTAAHASDQADGAEVSAEQVQAEQWQAEQWIESCSKLRQDMLYSIFSTPPAGGGPVEDRRSSTWKVAAWREASKTDLV
jgi:hypothetical protein